MNKNFLNKKTYLILALIWFFITFSMIESTYAKYVTNLGASANIAISYWNIKVNEQDILENAELTSMMTIVAPGNDYAKADVIVPNATGYFDINIDSSELQLPFNVTISTSLNSSSDLKKDFILTGYSVNNGSIITELGDDGASFTYPVQATRDTTIIRVYTTWQDDGLPSTDDTALGISGGKVILDVNLSFSQAV